MSQPIPMALGTFVETSQFQLPAGVATQDAKELLGQLALMTKEVFGCDVQVAEDYDPEVPDDRHVVFIVQPRAAMQRLVEMEDQWVKRMRILAPDWESVRLSIRLPE